MKVTKIHDLLLSKRAGFTPKIILGILQIEWCLIKKHGLYTMKMTKCGRFAPHQKTKNFPNLMIFGQKAWAKGHESDQNL